MTRSSLPASPLTLPVPGAVATGTLLRLAFVVVALHAILLALTHWLLLQRFLGRTLIDVAQPVALAFWRYTMHVYRAEAVTLAAAAAAVLAVRLVLGREGSGGRLAAAGLLAYTPVTVYSAVVLLALVLGWQPDVWLMSATNVSDSEIAATIGEALPTVLAPLLIGRHVATLLAAVTFGVLLRRLCRSGAGHASILTAAAGTAALSAQLLMLGVPMLE